MCLLYVNINIVYLSLYILKLSSFCFKHNTNLWAGATLLARTPTRGVTDFPSRDVPVPYIRARNSSLDLSLLLARLTLSSSTFPDDGGRFFGRWKLGVENFNLAGIPRTSYFCQMFGRRRTPSAHQYLLMFRIDRPRTRIISSHVVPGPSQWFFHFGREIVIAGLIGWVRWMFQNLPFPCGSRGPWKQQWYWASVPPIAAVFSLVRANTTSSPKWKNHCEGSCTTIAPKLLYGRKEFDLVELLSPLAIQSLLY